MEVGITYMWLYFHAVGLNFLWTYLG